MRRMGSWRLQDAFLHVATNNESDKRVTVTIMKVLGFSNIERLFGLTVLGFLLLLMGLLSWVKVNDYVDNVTGKIVTISPPIKLIAEEQAMIQKVLVKRDQLVRKGEVLVEFDRKELLAEQQQLHADLEKYQREVTVKTQEEKILEEKLKINRRVIAEKKALQKISQQRATIDAKSATDKAADIEHLEAVSRQMLKNTAKHMDDPRFSSLDKMKILADAHNNLRDMSELSSNAKSVLLDAEEAARKYAIEIALLEKENLELELDRQRLGGDLADSQNELAKLSIRQGVLANRLERLVLRAPVDGQVVFVADSLLRSNIAKSNEELLVIQAEGAVLQAELSMTDEQYKDARVGQRVNLELYAWNHYRHGVVSGRIIDVSEDKITTPSFDRPAFIARVELPVKAGIDLKTGFSLKAKIILGRISLYHYLLKKLNLG